jgi:hypothetical protein
MRAFVYQDWPSRDEVEWTNRFSASLRDAEFDVLQEWTLPKPPPPEVVETALRESGRDHPSAAWPRLARIASVVFQCRRGPVWQQGGSRRLEPGNTG